MKKYTTPYIELDELHTTEDVLILSSDVEGNNMLPTIWL